MKTLNIIKYVFSLIGLGMLVGAYFLYSNTASFLEQAVTAEGEVVELVRSRSSDSVSYYPVVVFQDDDGRQVEFKSNTGSNPPSYNRGERVSVLYETSNPEGARINGFFSLWGGAVIVGVLGLVFATVGGGMVLAGVLKRRSRDYLKHKGVQIHATLQGVERNTGLKVNGRSPYRIVCQWQHPQTSEIHVFHSDNLWFDPTDHIQGDTVPVLVDETNLKRYWVDTSFLPQLAS
ncbi:DUF3592 domain-containing protein [Marinobacter sp. SS21]|uniref:DUF3592 domain-containing protein n=1 Tax=Marinobacter sp. SS21 TaxID=2979460 RepID=UPI00232B6E0E|nr:DUF3592 domain-containing protein [Marinobacter sp. SS21]MDC0663594.1 DUF3592 domain-containing protein [Marinobacter sp. SS21]